MTGSIWTGAAAAIVFIILILAFLWRPLRPNPQRDDNGEAIERETGHVRDQAERAYGEFNHEDGVFEPCARAQAIEDYRNDPRANAFNAFNAFEPVVKPVDWRIDALHRLWEGRVSREGIQQILAGGADIGKFTVDRARKVLDAIEVGKPMMRRVEALLEERGEEDTQVTILHHGTGRYRAIIRRGRHRGSAMVSDDMNHNQFIDAIISATEKLRAPQEASFLGAAGGPEDMFEQGAVSQKGEDGGEG